MLKSSATQRSLLMYERLQGSIIFAITFEVGDVQNPESVSCRFHPTKNSTCPLCCMNLHSGHMHGEIFPNSTMTSGNYLAGGYLKSSISLQHTMYNRTLPKINVVTMCRHFTQAYKSRIWPGLTSSETPFSTYLVSGIRFTLLVVHTKLISMLVPWKQQWACVDASS